MAFHRGDLVLVAALGKGTVREVRRGGRYLVEIRDDRCSSRKDNSHRSSCGRSAQRLPPRSRASTTLHARMRRHRSISMA
jgi:hypothetical protein